MSQPGSRPSALRPPAFRPLRLGTVKPRGWLERQLQIQAAGLSGNLDLFWPDVAGSQWFGGKAEAWERAPYWLDGAVPLAYLLPDSPLRSRVQEKVGAIISAQEEDGWLGPREMVIFEGAAAAQHYDLWAQFLALKVLIQYHDATGDARAAVAVEKNLHCIEEILDRRTLHNWGHMRWFEALIAIQWLYDRSGESWLLDLAETVAAQGFNWAGYFARWPFKEPPAAGRWTYAGHVVNNAMAVKAYGLKWRHSGDTRDRDAVYGMIDALDRYHGTVTGVFSGDECLAGKSPTRGTELCAVLEYAYSLEVLIGILGDPVLADRLEKIAYNAMPATFSPDMWSHQYDQQANQVECSVVDERAWGTNGPDSNIFGLEPNYGCCTANLSQGWPKLAAHVWMALAGDADGSASGLACVVYAPCEVAARVAGAEVTVTTDTEYPFRDHARITVRAGTPARFPLLLRIPAWAEGAEVRIDGAPEPPLRPAAGTFCTLDREWRGTTSLSVRLPMRPRLVQGYRGAVALERGPLVYALRIGEEWRRINADLPGRELPHGDWEVHSTTAWNYGIQVSPETVDNDVTFAERPVGDFPFSPEGAPVVAKLSGRRVPGWEMVNGSAADAPESPVSSEEPLEELTFIPYGCTNLRMTELPLVRPTLPGCQEADT